MISLSVLILSGSVISCAGDHPRHMNYDNCVPVRTRIISRCFQSCWNYTIHKHDNKRLVVVIIEKYDLLLNIAAGSRRHHESSRRAGIHSQCTTVVLSKHGNSICVLRLLVVYLTGILKFSFSSSIFSGLTFIRTVPNLSGSCTQEMTWNLNFASIRSTPRDGI
jgi:hypothetical protein